MVKSDSPFSKILLGIGPELVLYTLFLYDLRRPSKGTFVRGRSKNSRLKVLNPFLSIYVVVTRVESPSGPLSSTDTTGRRTDVPLDALFN